MKMTLQFKDYLNALGAQSNEPLSIASALKPFGIKDAPEALDDGLLVGHLLDALSEEFLEPEALDAGDVIRVMEDLGSPLFL